MSGAPDTTTRLIRLAGALSGMLAVAALTVAATAVGDRGTGAAARIEVSVRQDAALHAAPAAPHAVLRGPLQVGERATGSFTLRNDSGRPLPVALRALGRATAVDGDLRLRLSAGGKTLADTTLRELRRQPSAPAALGAGERARFDLVAWVPASMSPAWQGNGARVALRSSAEPGE